MPPEASPRRPTAPQRREHPSSALQPTSLATSSSRSTIEQNQPIRTRACTHQVGHLLKQVAPRAVGHHACRQMAGKERAVSGAGKWRGRKEQPMEQASSHREDEGRHRVACKRGVVKQSGIARDVHQQPRRLPKWWPCPPTPAPQVAALPNNTTRTAHALCRCRHILPDVLLARLQAQAAGQAERY